MQLGEVERMCEQEASPPAGKSSSSGNAKCVLGDEDASAGRNRRLLGSRRGETSDEAYSLA